MAIAVKVDAILADVGFPGCFGVQTAGSNQLSSAYGVSY
jgi:hypothetical protein